MQKFSVMVTLEDGRQITSPPEDLNPGEDLYEVAQDLAERSDKGRFFMIDGGSTFQKLIPMGKIAFIDVLAVEEAENSADANVRTSLSLVKTPS